MLETERLVLREIRPEDEAAIFSYAADEEVTRYVGFPTHRSIDDTRRYLAEIFRKLQKYPLREWIWAICPKDDPEVLIGTIDIKLTSEEHGHAETEFTLTKSRWGYGLMTEAAREVIRFGFESLGVNRIRAYCRPENIASCRVLEKVDMTNEGVVRESLYFDGKYHDMKLYAILRRDWDGRTLPPPAYRIGWTETAAPKGSRTPGQNGD